MSIPRIMADNGPDKKGRLPEGNSEGVAPDDSGGGNKDDALMALLAAWGLGGSGACTL